MKLRREMLPVRAAAAILSSRTFFSSVMLILHWSCVSRSLRRNIVVPASDDPNVSNPGIVGMRHSASQNRIGTRLDDKRKNNDRTHSQQRIDTSRSAGTGTAILYGNCAKSGAYCKFRNTGKYLRTTLVLIPIFCPHHIYPENMIVISMSFRNL